MGEYRIRSIYFSIYKCSSRSYSLIIFVYTFVLAAKKKLTA
jgi:hypothetical protein